MYKLTITDPLGKVTVENTEKYKVKGKTLYIYKLVGGESDSVAQLETEVLTQIRQFIALTIEEEDDGV